MSVITTAGTPGVNRFTRSQLLRTAHDRELIAGEGRSFGARHIYEVSNLASLPALSVHVYSPALTRMTRYAVVDDRLERTGVERAGED